LAQPLPVAAQPDHPGVKMRIWLKKFGSENHL
jgi:hypothetical protein